MGLISLYGTGSRTAEKRPMENSEQKRQVLGLLDAIDTRQAEITFLSRKGSPEHMKRRTEATADARWYGEQLTSYPIEAIMATERSLLRRMYARAAAMTVSVLSGIYLYNAAIFHFIPNSPLLLNELPFIPRTPLALFGAAVGTMQAILLPGYLAPGETFDASRLRILRSAKNHMLNHTAPSAGTRAASPKPQTA